MNAAIACGELPLYTLACVHPESALYLCQDCGVSGPSRSAVSTLASLTFCGASPGASVPAIRKKEVHGASLSWIWRHF